MTWFPVPIWLETLISCGNGLQFWSWVAEENRTNGLKPKPSSTYLAFHHVTKQSDMIFSAEVQPYPDYPSQPCIQDLNIPYDIGHRSKIMTRQTLCHFSFFWLIQWYFLLGCESLHLHPVALPSQTAQPLVDGCSHHS
jgi:hypothetical protein